jgi:hypothetical protein
MTASKPRTLVVALAIAVLGALAVAGVSRAAAVTGTFEFPETFSEPVDFTGTCLGAGASGTVTHEATTVLHFTGTPAMGFHAHRATTDNVRSEFVDGRSIVGTLVAHSSENATAQDHFTTTATVHGTGTLYDSEGQPLGPVSLHQVSHITYQAGELTADVDRLRLTC